ncbi:MAG: hypothetical protein ACXIUV_07255 [Alkalilacustris sp.]
MLDLAFALPLTRLTAVFLWRAHPVGDLLAIALLAHHQINGDEAEDRPELERRLQPWLDSGA